MAKEGMPCKFSSSCQRLPSNLQCASCKRWRTRRANRAKAVKTQRAWKFGHWVPVALRNQYDFLSRVKKCVRANGATQMHWFIKCAYGPCSVTWRARWEKHQTKYRHCREHRFIARKKQQARKIFPKKFWPFLSVHRKAATKASYGRVCRLQGTCQDCGKIFLLQNYKAYKKGIYCEGCLKFRRHIPASIINAAVRGKDRRRYVKCQYVGCIRYCPYKKRARLSDYICRPCSFLRTKRKNAFKKSFYLLKWAARSRGIAMQLNISQMAALISAGKCFYCRKALSLRNGTILTFEELAGTKVSKSSSGYFIDRIDNKAPYAWSNSITACSRCNWMKSWFVSAKDALIFGLLSSGNLPAAHVAAQLSHTAIRRRMAMWRKQCIQKYRSISLLPGPQLHAQQ